MKTEISYSSCCRKKRQNFSANELITTGLFKPSAKSYQTLLIKSPPKHSENSVRICNTFIPESSLISGLPSKPPIRHTASHNSNRPTPFVNPRTAVIVITSVKLRRRGGGKSEPEERSEERREKGRWKETRRTDASYLSRRIEGELPPPVTRCRSQADMSAVVVPE